MNITYRIFILVLSLFVIISSWAQCPEGIVLLSSDEEILAFAKQYPNCTNLDSSLIIGPNTEMKTTRITNINPLSKIKSVNGDMKLLNNPWLKSVKALENIEEVKGDFQLSLNMEMDEEIFNSKLIIVNGDFNYNQPCIECKSKFLFEDLIKVGNGLILSVRKPIGKMFPSLWKIGGSIWSYNQKEIFVDGNFPSLESIGGNLHLHAEINDINAFQNLRSVNGLILYASKNRKINIGPIKYCQSIEIRMGLEHNMSFLNTIDSLSTLKITYLNQKLIDNLSNLSFVRGLLIRKVSEDVKQGFENLRSVGQLISIKELRVIKKIRHIEEFVIYNSLSLAVLDSLENLEKIDNVKLKLEKVDSIQIAFNFEVDRFRVEYQSKLNSLKMIIAKPLHSLVIMNNSTLESIGIIDPSNELGRLQIIGNEMLNHCNILEICNYLKSEKSEIEIRNNGLECDIEKLKKACSF